MIEKLARAIADQVFGPFDSMTKRDQDKLTNAARACLEALREPTPEMVKAAKAVRVAIFADDEDPEEHDVTSLSESETRQVWQSMIDVALERKAA